MSDPNTPPPMDDSGSGENPPPDETPANPEPVAGEPSPSEPTPIEPEAAVASETTVGGVGLGQGTLSEPDEKTMGLLAHILGGVTSFVGPLIIWLIKKDESPFIDDQGKEALNFQITILIGYVASAIIAMIPLVQCITVLLYPAIGITSLIFAILGGIEANKGVAYRYPFAARFVS